MDLDWYEQTFRWVGVVAALVASVLAVPGAVAHVGSALRLLLRRWFGKPQVAHGSISAVALAFTASAHGYRPADPTAPVPERLAFLEEQHGRTQEQIGQVLTRLNTEARDREQALARVAELSHAELLALRAGVAEDERRDRVVDAMALPIIGLGVLLSGGSPELAAHPWIGSVLVGLLVVWLPFGVWRFAKELRQA